MFGSGAVGAVVAVGTTFTSSFIPWLQCPGIPQMKYLDKIDQKLIYKINILPSIQIIIWS